METLLKVHQTRPIEIPLPGNQTLNLFITGYDKDDSDPVTDTYHIIKCHYYNSSRLSYLTKKIIDSYISRHLRLHLKLFSIDGYIKPIIEIK
jgi:hypothetical protein